MKCPFCGYDDSKVIDSRPADEGARVRRRRECLECSKRFTTYEIIETAPILVIKRDDSRETFNASKLLRGMSRACEKRPVPIETLEKAVDQIQTEILNSLQREIDSSSLGELALTKLKSIDEVAYIRFASVYRHFQDIDSFYEELRQMTENKKDATH